MPATLNCEAQSICLYNNRILSNPTPDLIINRLHFLFCTRFTPRTKTLTRPLKS
ncbi:hypothetical protein C0J52_02519 [Blattella germanica]|nr:hypothetical protein C0J52_02519 [Blattella germanica]